MAGAAKELKILVVDDDPLVRNLLLEVLNDTRLVLYEATDGISAMKLAAQVRPDVILLDVMMPGMNGYETCRALRADPELARARIIMLTARSGESAREEAMKSGADAFFVKP